MVWDALWVTVEWEISLLPALCLSLSSTYTFGTRLGTTTYPTNQTSSREFSSSSAYKALFVGRTCIAGVDRIWKVQAPGWHFFRWLVLHGRCWTSNCLCRHELQDSDDCALCAQEVETLDHLLLRCVHSRETWLRILHYYGLQHLAPQEELPFFEWWVATWKQVHKLSLL
jgi:hypothetical protein